ncbi:FAD-dependent oxidoreductase [Marinicella sp. W31]|uniref:FAD-dependent oxidoreductase n=1 Tax=Marinicella sp. W31 TaxID=3023713 RepID=UPI0037571AD8
MKRITIIGAGLVGSLKAIYLAQRGYAVDVYEKLPDIRKEKIAAGRSINLAMANRGLGALEAVGVKPLIEPLLIPMKGRMLHDEDGQLQFQSYGQRPHEVIYSVSRAGLVSILRDQAEATGQVRFHFKAKLESIDFDNSRLVMKDVVKDTELQVDYDYLIACDGGGSRVRRAMEAAGLTQYSSELLDHSYKELTIPPDADGHFRMEINALHIWPRGEYMLIALPNPDASFTVTLFMPNIGSKSFEHLTDKAAVKAFFETHFQDTLSLIPDLANEFFENPTGYLGTIRTQKWQHKNVVLSGDAAHAIVPFHGQGMNAGFEDCFELNRCLDESRDEDGNDDWEAALPLFVENRIDNANAIADMALDNYIEMRSDVRDPNFHLKKQIAFELEKRYPDTFIPRYSMVSFHHIPYKEAQRRGKIQAEILSALAEGKDALEQVSFEQAAIYIKERLSESVY